MRDKWWLPLIVALASLVVSAYANYNKTDKEITGRVIKLETQREADVASLERIEKKVDRILERVNR